MDLSFCQRQQEDLLWKRKQMSLGKIPTLKQKKKSHKTDKSVNRLKRAATKPQMLEGDFLKYSQQQARLAKKKWAQEIKVI